jgi:hypothetical protein
MVMARRSERISGGGRLRTMPRTAGGVRRSPATYAITTGLHDPVRSVPGSTTSHQPQHPETDHAYRRLRHVR